MKVFIYGGCVSRDIFNYMNQNDFTLVEYFARSSYASAFSSLTVEDKWSANIKSNFQRRMVKSDLDKQLPSLLKSTSFDIILLDFNSERMPLFIFSSGAKCSFSAELSSSGFNPSLVSGRLVEPFTDEMYSLWEKGWEKFIELMDKYQHRDMILVNKSLWTKNTDDNSQFEGVFNTNYIEAANNYLNRVYKRISKDLKPNQFIAISDENLVSSSNHRWGKNPFHYIDAAYNELGNLIKNFYLAKNGMKKSYNLSNWGVVTKSSIDDICSNGLLDGLNKVIFVDGREIDLFVKNSSLIKAGGKLLVSFNGAISNRAGKQGPFFSGVGISAELDIPVISIADPSLDLCGELPLSWYAGNEWFLNCAQSISDIIDTIANKYKVDLIFFGGSGGGFASLLISQTIKTKIKCLVWNPQTSITKYSNFFVNQYFKTAFPSKSLESAQEQYSSEYICQVLDDLKIVHDLQGVRLRDNVSIIYLQNQSDWHTNKHAIPFLKNITPFRFGDCSFVSEDNNSLAYIGNWGEGHVAPPKEVIKSLLSDIINGCHTNEILSRLNEGQYFQGHATFFDDFFLSDKDWHVNANINDGKVECSVSISKFERSDYKFAFYLLVDQKKHQIREYTYDNSATIKLPSSYKEIEVVGYAMDSFKNRYLKKVRLV